MDTCQNTERDTQRTPTDTVERGGLEQLAFMGFFKRIFLTLFSDGHRQMVICECLLFRLTVISSVHPWRGNRSYFKVTSNSRQNIDCFCLPTHKCQIWCHRSLLMFTDWTALNVWTLDRSKKKLTLLVSEVSSQIVLVEPDWLTHRISCRFAPQA
jgi:hypothetical protein